MPELLFRGRYTQFARLDKPSTFALMAEVVVEGIDICESVVLLTNPVEGSTKLTLEMQNSLLMIYEAKTLIEVMGMQGFVVVVGAERNGIAVASTERVIVPVFDQSRRAVIIAAAIRITGGGDITEAGYITLSLQEASVFIDADSTTAITRTMSNSLTLILFKLKINQYYHCQLIPIFGYFDFEYWIVASKTPQSLSYKLRKMEINGEEENEVEQLTGKMLHRLDRLELSRWHIFVTLALGLVWIFDGYEVTLISLYRNEIVNQSSENVFKSLISAYQIGGIVGSLLFGVMAFIIGRRKIFIITLVIYFIGVIFSGIRTNSFIFILSRFLTGLSVGGEFTAIFTAVDEFLPPKYRGRVNIGIDGTWHLGGTLASVLTMIVGETTNWRYMFLLGIFGIFSLFIMRRTVPESPRWLLSKQRVNQSRQIIEQIEVAVNNNDFLLRPAHSDTVQIDQSRQLGTKSLGYYCIQIWGIIVTAISKQTRKFLVSFILIFTQALFFNLVYYQYPDILANEYDLDQEEISLYMLPLSVVSFISTLFIGPYFDKIGRRKLLLATYGLSGIILIISYQCTDLASREVTVVILFIFASPAGSSANLIASQIFSTSSRTIVLFIMFIISMLGGMCGVWFDNYLIASILMIFAGVMAFIFCPNSENKSLEEIEKM